MNVPNNNKVSELREPKTKIVGKYKTIVDEKLNEEHKYKNITINNISFFQYEKSYIFEMTVENKSQETFSAEDTYLVFYTNTEKEIGKITFTSPALEPGTIEDIIIEIKDSKFFSACDFRLKESKQKPFSQEENKTPQPDAVG